MGEYGRNEVEVSEKKWKKTAEYRVHCAVGIDV
jgi:hypothetical protein